MTTTTSTATTRPVRLDSTIEAIGFGARILLLPGGGCGGAAGHVVRAIEAADDEVGIEALEFAIYEGEG
jgi:hypothetical protein